MRTCGNRRPGRKRRSLEDRGQCKQSLIERVDRIDRTCTVFTSSVPLRLRTVIPGLSGTTLLKSTLPDVIWSSRQAEPKLANLTLSAVKPKSELNRPFQGTESMFWYFASSM